MTVTAAMLDEQGVSHAVFKRVRMACCTHAAVGIDVNMHALHVARLVSNLNHDGPGRFPRQEKRGQGQTGAQ